MKAPPLPEFRAIEWTHVRGRGDLANIAKCHPDPRSLAGKQVMIDGIEYEVLGVETPATMEWSGDFGLLVRKSTTYRSIAARATTDEAYRQGLIDAARVCRAQRRSTATAPGCPPGIVAYYIEQLAKGEMP